MSKTSTKFVSVFIPTFNGQKYIGECIDAILKQELPAGYELELLVTDSGSSDGTVEIVKKYGQKLSFNTIPNSEFSHGGTRAKAAQMAKGEFILFLTQDATPADTRWLINMLEPFFVSEQVGCVFGRQIPRGDVAATIKREVATAFASLGAPDALILHRNKSLVDHEETNGLNTFFSDANSAVRRDLLVGPVPFRNVPYAEDQALAEDMQKAGYLKAYAPQGAVLHSNEYTPREYYKRKFDEFIAIQEQLGKKVTASKRSLWLGWIRPTLADYRFIRHDAEYGAKSKLLWFLKAPLYNIAAKAGQYNAIKYLNDHATRAKISLEHNNRNGS